MDTIKTHIRIAGIIFLFTLLSTATFGQKKNFFLTNNYTQGIVNLSLAKDHSWIKYPPYDDRAGWAKISEGVRKKTIADAEKFLGYNWPQAKATMFLEFSRSGNRNLVDEVARQRRVAYISLLMAELMEGKGRFLDDIINGVFDICQTTYWGHSAHLYLNGYEEINGSINKPYTVLPEIDNPIIDLKVGDVAADLAWTYYFLHREFDKVSPVISQRLKNELFQKVLKPYYERNDFWWIYGWKEGTRIYEEYNWTMNNWTPWITYNILTCILLMEDDPQRRLSGIWKTMYSIDLFTDCYPVDGACMEGFSYWRRAGGHFLNYLDLLKRATNGKIDIFDREMVKNRGKFVYRAYVGNGENYISFANSPPRTRHNPGLIYRFGRAIDDPVMKGFGVFLMKKYNFWDNAIEIFPASMGETFENLFNIQDWQETEPHEPLLPEFYFPDSEIAVARDKEGSTDGFYYAAWGNNNGGGHNDNDVGSFILHFNGHPVFIDRSAVASTMHSVPLINGVAQGRGGKYKAKDARFTSSAKEVSFSADITEAYPSQAGIKKWLRAYTLVKGTKFVIADEFQLTENSGDTRLHYITGLKSTLLKPGVVELEGKDFKLHMKYDPAVLSFSSEPLSGRSESTRLVLSLEKKTTSGKSKIEITEVKNR